MVTFIFTFDLRSGYVQVKNIKFWRSKFSFKIIPFCSVLSQNSKNSIRFVVRQLQIRKIEFQRNDVMSFASSLEQNEPYKISLFKILPWTAIRCQPAYLLLLASQEKINDADNLDRFRWPTCFASDYTRLIEPDHYGIPAQYKSAVMNRSDHEASHPATGH